ncbi:hypothetical protein ACQEVM_37455 [Streptomyces sp. CA-243310]|uniref:hypothetical protein n=1 Tax=Streptomyces sp. CA-243310 TaxID=3240056 RepID=UPI003D8C3932
MSEILDEQAARHQAGSRHPGAIGFKPFTDQSDTLIGWTYATDSRRRRYGWILTDGRISPATEDHRSGAEEYGRRSI